MPPFGGFDGEQSEIDEYISRIDPAIGTVHRFCRQIPTDTGADQQRLATAATVDSLTRNVPLIRISHGQAGLFWRAPSFSDIQSPDEQSDYAEGNEPADHAGKDQEQWQIGASLD